MVNHPSPSRSWHRPFGFVRSTLLILTLAFSTLTQAHPVIVLNTPAEGSVTSCTSYITSWTILQPAPDVEVQDAINSTYIGIWATNIDVDQTPIHTTPTNPGVPKRQLSRLSARQQVVAAPVTTNVTIQAVPLISGTTTSGGFYTWAPIRLPPNQYYVMYLQSLPGRSRGLEISVKSEKFFVSEGASDSCLAGIVQSITVTPSTAETALPSGTSTPDDGTTGQNNIASNSNKNRTGAIVGGVIGGLGLLGLLIFTLLYCLKRRKSDNKEDLGDFLATRGVNPYGRRSITNIERRVSSYEPTKYGGILAAIGIHPVSSEKQSTQDPREFRHSGSFYPRRFSYQRQPEDHLDGTEGKRTSFSRFRSSDVMDMATMLAADPTTETTSAEKSGTRRSKSSSITTFAQSAANVPYHPYNSASADGHEADGIARRASQRHHKRHSSLQMQRASEGYAMSPISRASATLEDAEPEVMPWTGPTHKRASTAMSGAMSSGEPRSSEGEPRFSGNEPRSSEGGEFGSLTPDQGGAPLVRKKSGAGSGKSPSTKASVTRKKAPDLPLPKDGSLETGIQAPPSAYITPTNPNSPSTTTVNTGASAYVPSQATRDRRSADLMAYQNGRRSSEVFGPGTSAPGQGGAFDAFAGAKEGPVHILMPDLPPGQAQ